jgi:hypothetical protein
VVQVLAREGQADDLREDGKGANNLSKNWSMEIWSTSAKLDDSLPQVCETAHFKSAGFPLGSGC